MAEYFISKEDLPRWVGMMLADRQVVAPVNEFGVKHIASISPENIGSIDLSGFRTIEPLKSYFFKIIETVSCYFGHQIHGGAGKILILGARGCDLEGLEVEDRVFTDGEFKDGFYAANRENSFIVGADCTDCGRTCFCTLMKGKPFPAKLFDLNLSPVEGGFVVQVGTEAGQKMIDQNRAIFSTADPKQIEEREKNRTAMTERLIEQNKGFGIRAELSASHRINLRNKAWQGLTKDCVECSACNFVCPTCTCFLLTDEDKRSSYQRDKSWDACLKAGYARLAGGANPRGKLHERLQNRYQCKCDYSYDRLARYACVGCGRCIDGCAGNIDMRKIFAELERLAPLTANLA